MCSPGTLIPAQRQDQLLPLGKETMIDPIPGIRFPIQRRALDINICRIRRIEIDIPHSGRLPRLRVGDVDVLEIRRRDEVDVLARVGEETHHAEGHEGAHCAAVVVAGETVGGRGEVARDVGVGAEGGEGGAAGVVVLEDG